MQPNFVANGSAITANGQVQFNGAGSFALPGNVHVISAYFGASVTFGSGTLTLEVSPDGGTTWVSTGVTITTATANSFRQSNLVYGSLFRWTLSGATSPNINLTVKASQVRYGTVDAFLLTGNGASQPFILKDIADYLLAPHAFDACLQAVGTFGSGTVALEVSPDGGTTWFRAATLTANGYSVVNTGFTDFLCRVNLTGATSPSITVRVVK